MELSEKPLLSCTSARTATEHESDFDWTQVGGERVLLEELVDMSVNLPITSHQLTTALLKKQSVRITHSSVANLLYKFAAQNLIRYVIISSSLWYERSTDRFNFRFSFKNITVDGQQGLKILTAEHAKLLAMINDLSSDVDTSAYLEKSRLLIENKIKQLECKI